MPLLYIFSIEKANPCASTLSIHPFMMAGTLNQYKGNCMEGYNKQNKPYWDFNSNNTFVPQAYIENR
jgi:hypothetical protein